MCDYGIAREGCLVTASARVGDGVQYPSMDPRHLPSVPGAEVRSRRSHGHVGKRDRGLLGVFFRVFMFFMFWDATSLSSSENGKGRIGDFEGRGRVLVFSGGFEGKAFKELENPLLVEPTAHSRSGISGEAR